MKEKISALIDDELDELDTRRVLDALRADVELRRTWERYHFIRAAVTRQLGVFAPRDLADRVAARLDAETESGAASLRFWPLVGGFAAAASVAAIAIVGFQMMHEPTPPVALAPGPTPVAVASVGTNAPTAVATTPTTPTSLHPENRLNLYLVGHNEFMPTGGMGSMLPYVRVVADDPDR